jgi:translation initiation factor IF-3
VTTINQNLRCNEQIRITPIRLIGANEEQIGVIATFEALKMAREAGVDLVEVAPTARPPVCRLMDYGKWKYKQKKSVKKHHEQELKEVRLRPKTDTHDREIKVNNAKKFFKEGDKVQFTMVFRGRERSHREIAFEAFQDILNEFGDKVKVERPPGMDGRHMIMILSPVKGAFGNAEGAAPPAKPKPPRPAPVAASAAAKPAEEPVTAPASTAPIEGTA